MTPHDPAPLAALLASHPEECAAVVATLAMAGGDGIDWTRIHKLIAANEPALAGLNVEGVLEALKVADLLWIDEPLVGMRMEHRYAIARVGAAVWLRARVGAPAPLTYGQRIAHSFARLHDIAAAALRALDLAGAIAIAKVVDKAWTGNERGYRDALMDLVALGWTLDIEAEVAAVWGPVGAGVTKGVDK